MKKKLACILAISAALFTASYKPADASDLTLSAGYRMDNLKWNIAGTTAGTNPNILSELEWKDIESYQAKAKLRSMGKLVYFRAYADYAWIFEGENRDSDYAFDNRTGEFSRSENKADDGNLWDASAGIGLAFQGGGKTKSSFYVAPLVGFSYHRQDLRIREGNQVIPPTGPFPGLDSKYRADWYGPWAGLDLSYRFDKLRLSASVEGHLAEYEAEADWNLRDDFQHPVSFEHTADGQGIIVTVEGDYAVTDNVAINLSYDYQDWETDEGTDKTFFANGTVGETRLNEVKWDSNAFMVGIKFMF